MSYPDISAVILDASFDDLVPLALKVMPDSWREYSSLAGPSRQGGSTGLFGLGAVTVWVEIGHPVAEKQGFPAQWTVGPLG